MNNINQKQKQRSLYRLGIIFVNDDCLDYRIFYFVYDLPLVENVVKTNVAYDRPVD